MFSRKWIRLVWLIEETLLLCLLRDFRPVTAVCMHRQMMTPLSHIFPDIRPPATHQGPLSGLLKGTGRQRRAGPCVFPANGILVTPLRSSRPAAPLRGLVAFAQREGSARNPKIRQQCHSKSSTQLKGPPLGDPHRDLTRNPQHAQTSAASALRKELLRKAKVEEDMKNAFPVVLRVPHPELIAGETHPTHTLGFTP